MRRWPTPTAASVRPFWCRPAPPVSKGRVLGYIWDEEAGQMLQEQMIDQGLAESSTFTRNRGQHRAHLGEIDRQAHERAVGLFGPPPESWQSPPVHPEAEQPTPPAAARRGRIVEAIDGETFRVVYADGSEGIVRLRDVNAPSVKGVQGARQTGYYGAEALAYRHVRSSASRSRSRRRTPTMIRSSQTSGQQTTA